MSKHFTFPVTYFLREGKANLRQTIQLSLEAVIAHNLEKLIVFTSHGEGLKLALEMTKSVESRFSAIRLIGVTFPQGMRFTDKDNQDVVVDILPSDLELFARENIPILRAHLPFSPIPPSFKGRGHLGNDLSLVGNALLMFGGGMPLCVQSVLIACDAGVVPIGEHVVACTADTSILAQSTCTTKLLTDFIVREILCKAALFDIGKKEKIEAQLTLEENTDDPATLNAKKLPPFSKK